MGAIIAFDGLSLAGKSTFAQMLAERSVDAVVLSENLLDPFRPVTAQLNRIFKEKPDITVADALARIVAAHPQHTKLALEARNYVTDLGPMEQAAQQQASLAYFFAHGRAAVNEKVQQFSAASDVILDRWRVSGVYQAQPSSQSAGYAYSWLDVMKLNDRKGILYPDMQGIVTFPIEQLSARRSYRQKQGLGTAGQMSAGREHIIYRSFLEVFNWLLHVGRPVIQVENDGVPCERLEEQIRQAIPQYALLEQNLRWAIDNGVAKHFESYRFSGVPFKDAREAEAFFLTPDVLERIYARQTAKQ